MPQAHTYRALGESLTPTRKTRAHRGVCEQGAALDEEPGDGEEGKGSRRNVIHRCDGVEAQAPPLDRHHT